MKPGEIIALIVVVITVIGIIAALIDMGRHGD